MIVIWSDKINKKICSFFVFLSLILITFQPASNCYNLKKINVDSFKTKFINRNFNFNEFIRYLQKNKEHFQITNNNNTKAATISSQGIIIIFKKNVNATKMEKIKVDEIWYNIIDRIPELNAVLIDTKREEPFYLKEKIKNRDDVLCAEINHNRFLSYEPNDPYWNESWGHKKINCDKAWDLEIKMKYSWLTILDTGLDADHEDLTSANIYQWDFIEDDGTANDVTGTGHGTNVTGIALARMNNSKGIAGVAGDCPNIEILKIFDEFKKTTIWLIIKSIIYSIIAHGPYSPSVICMCFGSEEYSLIENSLFDSLRYGNCKILFVAAVGNSGSSNRIDFPAGYKSVIAVGAINESGWLCRYPGDWGSNYNKNKREVDIVAPGVNIITTTDADIIGKKYGYFSGTSAATAYVAGVAILWYGVRTAIKGYKQRKNEPDTCEIALFSNAKSVGDKDPNKYGHGLIDAYKTIKKLKTNKVKLKFDLIKDFLLYFVLLEKNYKNRFIKILLTNDFLYRSIINNYIKKTKETLEYIWEDRYR